MIGHQPWAEAQGLMPCHSNLWLKRTNPCSGTWSNYFCTVFGCKDELFDWRSTNVLCHPVIALTSCRDLWTDAGETELGAEKDLSQVAIEESGVKRIVHCMPPYAKMCPHHYIPCWKMGHFRFFIATPVGGSKLGRKLDDTCWKSWFLHSISMRFPYVWFSLSSHFFPGLGAPQGGPWSLTQLTCPRTEARPSSRFSQSRIVECSETPVKRWKIGLNCHQFASENWSNTAGQFSMLFDDFPIQMQT